MAQADFKAVLARLSGDRDYWTRAMESPSVITADFNLTIAELSALKDAARLSGVDTKKIAQTEANAAADDIGCCCCCCCGETAVVRRV